MTVFIKQFLVVTLGKTHRSGSRVCETPSDKAQTPHLLGPESSEGKILLLPPPDPMG